MFAGIGGFRTGLTNAGDFFMPVGWCEKDKHAQKAYRLLYLIVMADGIRRVLDFNAADVI